MQRHQQEALWEFVHTELTYINKLIIIKAVRCPFESLHLNGRFILTCVRDDGGFSAGCFLLTELCSPLTVGRCSPCEPASKRISPGGQSLKTHKQPTGLFSTVLHWHTFTATKRTSARADTEIQQGQTENVARHVSTEKVETITKQGGLASTPGFFKHVVSPSCDRWNLSCSSPTSPPSSVHTSSSGRRWFIPCYRKSAGQGSPLTPWG